MVPPRGRSRSACFGLIQQEGKTKHCRNNIASGSQYISLLPRQGLASSDIISEAPLRVEARGVVKPGSVYTFPGLQPIGAVQAPKFLLRKDGIRDCSCFVHRAVHAVEMP